MSKSPSPADADVVAQPVADLNPPVSDSTEPVKIAGLDDVRDMTHEQFLASLGFRNAEPPKEYTPPPMTERQRSVINEEMEAGRRRVAFNDAAKKAQLGTGIDKTEGTTTPVYRPGDGAGTKDVEKTKAFR